MGNCGALPIRLTRLPISLAPLLGAVLRLSTGPPHAGLLAAACHPCSASGLPRAAATGRRLLGTTARAALTGDAPRTQQLLLPVPHVPDQATPPDVLDRDNTSILVSSRPTIVVPDATPGTVPTQVAPELLVATALHTRGLVDPQLLIAPSLLATLHGLLVEARVRRPAVAMELRKAAGLSVGSVVTEPHPTLASFVTPLRPTRARSDGLDVVAAADVVRLTLELRSPIGLRLVHLTGPLEAVPDSLDTQLQDHQTDCPLQLTPSTR